MFCQKIGLQVRLCWTWLESSCFADVDLPCQEKTQIGTGVFWLVQPSIEHFHPSPDFSSLVWFSLKLLSGDCVADLGVLIMMQTQECEGHGFGSKMGDAKKWLFLWWKWWESFGIWGPFSASMARMAQMPVSVIVASTCAIAEISPQGKVVSTVLKWSITL